MRRFPVVGGDPRRLNHEQLRHRSDTEALAFQTPAVDGDAVTVTVAGGFADLPMRRQVPGLGQVIVSLAEGEAWIVTFVEAYGDRVSVPIAAGTIVGRPLQRADCVSLAIPAPPLAG